MVRRSPQTERLVEIIELLAAGGRGGHTLAELARFLGVDKATCYPMLVELTRVGWLVRHPRDKTYHLGPKLGLIGTAARSAIDTVELARPRLVDLARRSGGSCLLFTRSGDQLVIAEVAGRTGGSARTAPPLGLHEGDAIALRPPLGGVFVAWSSEEAERWLSLAPDADERARLTRVLAEVRARGFGVEVFTPAPETLAELNERAVGGLRGSRRAGQIILEQLQVDGRAQVVGTIDDAASYSPISINSPVFDLSGSVALAVVLTDLQLPMMGAEVARLGRDVARTATQIAKDAGVDRP